MEPIDITDEWEEWIDSLSKERMELISIRMNREIQDWDDEDEVAKVFSRITRTMMVQDTLSEMTSDGLVEIVGFDEEGHPLYCATDKGRAVFAYEDDDDY